MLAVALLAGGFAVVIGLLLPSPAPLPDTAAVAAAGLLAPPSPAPLPATTAAAAAAGLLAPVWLGVVPDIRTLAVLGMTGGSTEAIGACFKIGAPVTAAKFEAAAVALPDGTGPWLAIPGGAAATPAGALACPSCAAWVCMACCDAVSFLWM